MIKEVLSARVSADMAAAARARAEADGLRLTEVVEQALIAYLGLGDSPTSGGDLGARVAALEQRVSQLEASSQGQGRRGKGRR